MDRAPIRNFIEGQARAYVEWRQRAGEASEEGAGERMVARDIELASVKVLFQRETGEFELPASVSVEMLNDDVERDASGRHFTQVRLSQEDSVRSAWMQLRRHNQTMERRRCTRAMVEERRLNLEVALNSQISRGGIAC